MYFYALNFSFKCNTFTVCTRKWNVGNARSQK